MFSFLVVFFWGGWLPFDGEILLSECFVECDGGGVCEVVAACVESGHGEGSEAVVVGLVEILWESVLFVSEDEEISGVDFGLEEALVGFGGQEEHSFGGHFLEEMREIPPAVPLQEGPVVQSRPAEMCVVDLESQGVDEMEDCPGIDAESSDGSSVLGNFWGDKDDMEGDEGHGVVVGVEAWR